MPSGQHRFEVMRTVASATSIRTLEDFDCSFRRIKIKVPCAPSRSVLETRVAKSLLLIFWSNPRNYCAWLLAINDRLFIVNLWGTLEEPSSLRHLQSVQSRECPFVEVIVVESRAYRNEIVALVARVAQQVAAMGSFKPIEA